MAEGYLEMTRLSKNFTLEELIHTDTGIPNMPSMWNQEKLLYVATYLLQPIRDEFGALKVNSGYRNLRVNEAVGGSKDSQHLFGEAVDFTLFDLSLVKDLSSIKTRLNDVFDWIVLYSKIRYGQCIRESNNSKEWIHISLPRINGVNQQALYYDGRRYKIY